MNLVRAVSSEGFGRIKYNTRVRRSLETDMRFRAYFERETDDLPHFYLAQMKKDLGPLWQWLPEGALDHDPNAYLRSVEPSARSVHRTEPKHQRVAHEQPLVGQSVYVTP
jgi:hypothetical protein